ncbi:MAG: hypothetical protein K2P74_04405 [Nitrosomonas sp.]|nr:hypothetical protein [Nitrosomonas sp.]
MSEFLSIYIFIGSIFTAGVFILSDVKIKIQVFDDDADDVDSPLTTLLAVILICASWPLALYQIAMQYIDHSKNKD